MSETSALPPDSPAAAPAPSRRWWALATVALAQLMVVLDATVVNIALPTIQTDLGFSNGDRQWVVTAYSLAFGSLLLLGGRLSDLIGRKRSFLIALVGFAAASALGGAAQNFGVLVTARAVQGVFGALLAPTALAVLTTTFTNPKERGRAFGVFGAIAVSGGAIGLLLGGVLTEDLSWRWTLYINVAIAALALVGTVVFVSMAHRTGPRPRIDIPGAVLISASLFALVYGFSRAESDGWGDALTWSSLIVSGVLLVGFVFWQTRSNHPLLPLRVVLHRNRAASYYSVLTAAVAMFGIFLFTTYYMQTTLHYSPIKTGFAFMPMILMVITAAQLSTNFLLPKLGPKVLVPSGMVLAGIGMVWLTRLDVDSTFAGGLLVPLMIFGYGMGSIMPSAIQTATLGVDPHDAGVASAMVNTSQQIGASVGTALLNTLAATAATNYIADHRPPTSGVLTDAAVHSYAVAYWWVAGFFAVGTVVTALLFQRRAKATAQGAAEAAARQATPDAETEPVAVA